MISLEALRQQVATACRVIGLEGYVDLTLGHVSGRQPGSRTIWIKRKGVALDEVEPSDVIALDLDDPAAYSSPDYHLESVMHVEVYKARDDVNSVIHGHPVYGTALGATDATLQLLTHDAVLFTDGLGIYDEGPALVTEAGQGRAGRRRARVAPRLSAAQPWRGHRRRGCPLGGADRGHPGTRRALPIHQCVAGCRPTHPGRVGRCPSTPEIPGPVPG